MAINAAVIMDTYGPCGIRNKMSILERQTALSACCAVSISPALASARVGASQLEITPRYDRESFRENQ